MRLFASGLVALWLLAAGMASGPAQVPAGTPFKVQLETRLSTDDNKTGDAFAARVMTTVYVDGAMAIPSGTIVEGHVAHVRDARPIAGSSELLLRPDLLIMPDGQQYTISADVAEIDALTETSTDTEGMIRSPRRPSREYARRSGAAAVFTTIGGAALAGGKGAMVGGVFGVAAAGGWWFLRHKHAELNAGSELTLRLDRAVKLVPRETVAAKTIVPGAAIDAAAPALAVPGDAASARAQLDRASAAAQSASAAGESQPASPSAEGEDKQP